LSPEQRDVLRRLERGEIDAVRAELLLCGNAPPSALPPSEEPAPERPDETPEEAAARELVERIARDAYKDSTP